MTDLHDAHVIAFEHYEEFEKGDCCYHTGDNGRYSDPDEFNADYERRMRRIVRLTVSDEPRAPAVTFFIGGQRLWTGSDGQGLYSIHCCVCQPDEFSVRRYLSRSAVSRVRLIREYVRYRLPAILSALQ